MYKSIAFIAILLFVFCSQACTQRKLGKENNKNDSGKDGKLLEEIPGNQTEKPSNLEDDYSKNVFRLQKTAVEELVVEDKKETELTDIIVTKSESQKDKVNKKDQTKEKNSGVVPAPPPPAKSFFVRLQIENHNDYSMWYLMPYGGSNTLKGNGRFEASVLANQEFPIKGHLYEGADSSFLVELIFSASTNNSFRAFQIPAQGVLVLNNYQIDCWKDSDKIELWAVKDLMVNGQKNLSNVMPYTVLSSKKISVSCSKEKGCNWKLLERNIEGASTHQPEKISFIQAVEIQKYEVQLTDLKQ